MSAVKGWHVLARPRLGVVHQVGPILLGARQTYRIPFRRPGRFQYACSLHAAGTLTLFIEPEPAPGLARLRWRLERVGGQSGA